MVTVYAGGGQYASIEHTQTAALLNWRAAQLPLIAIIEIKADFRMGINTDFGTKQAIALLERNAEDFLNEGVAMILSQNATTANAKVAVVAIQTAAELLAKLAVVKNHGLPSIIINPPEDIEIYLNNYGVNFTTLGYSQILKVLTNSNLLSKYDREMLKQIQLLRNSLSHFGSDVDVSNVRQSVCWLLVRVLAIFAAGNDRDQAEFQSHASFLNEKNFDRLVAEPAYRDEAIEVANDSYETETVYTCWQCGNSSMSLRESETYFCWCCGLTADATAVSYTDCKLCQTENAVYYDRLNQTNGLYLGRCTECKTTVNFNWCKSCGETHMNKIQSRSQLL